MNDRLCLDDWPIIGLDFEQGIISKGGLNIHDIDASRNLRCLDWIRHHRSWNHGDDRRRYRYFCHVLRIDAYIKNFEFDGNAKANIRVNGHRFLFKLLPVCIEI